MTEKERVTVDLDAECYCLDGEFWVSWDNYGEQMADEINKEFNKLSEENNQLKREKERYKRLSEIRDEHINNRILSLKEFINNCEDEKVKNTLEDFFYSEVKEYNLAKENRKLKRENEQLKKDIEYLDEKIKENEWHWNTIDEDRDVWHYKCTQAEKRVKELKTKNEQLKKDRFICLDCKYCGYAEIGCLCEKQDHWEDFKSECNDFKELKYYDGDVE